MRTTWSNGAGRWLAAAAGMIAVFLLAALALPAHAQVAAATGASLPGWLVGPIIGILLPFLGSTLAALAVAWAAKAASWDQALDPMTSHAVNAAIATVLTILFNALGSGVIPAATSSCVQTASNVLGCLDAATINKIVLWLLSFIAAQATGQHLQLAKLRRAQLHLPPGALG